MKPKEKAQELVSKFTEPTQQWHEIKGYWQDDMDLAKECAVIAVDEILKVKGNQSPIWWGKVKEEIRKL